MTNSPSRRARENRVFRRNQLIDEAIGLIGRFGYHGFTVQALAEQCGLTNAGVLHYFGTKDRLLLSVLDEIERRAEDRIASLVTHAALGGPDCTAPFAASQSLLRGMMEWVLADPEQARFLTSLQAESMDQSHPAHEWFGARETETAALFTQLASAHGIDDPAAVARKLIALMYGLLMQWLRSDRAFDLVGEWVCAASQVLSQPNFAPLGRDC